MTVRLGMPVSIRGVRWMVVDISPCGQFVTVGRVAGALSREQLLHVKELVRS